MKPTQTVVKQVPNTQNKSVSEAELVDLTKRWTIEDAKEQYPPSLPIRPCHIDVNLELRVKWQITIFIF